MKLEQGREKDVRFIAGVQTMDSTDLMILNAIVEHSILNGAFGMVKEKFPGERPAQVVGLLLGAAAYVRTQEKTDESKT